MLFITYRSECKFSIKLIKTWTPGLLPPLASCCVAHQSLLTLHSNDTASGSSVPSHLSFLIALTHLLIFLSHDISSGNFSLNPCLDQMPPFFTLTDCVYLQFSPSHILMRWHIYVSVSSKGQGLLERKDHCINFPHFHFLAQGLLDNTCSINFC